MKTPNTITCTYQINISKALDKEFYIKHNQSAFIRIGRDVGSLTYSNGAAENNRERESV